VLSLVFGFTTAASVWLVAALEAGIGIVEYEVVGLSAAPVFSRSSGGPPVRQVINASQTITYEAMGPPNDVRHDQLSNLMSESGLSDPPPTV